MNLYPEFIRDYIKHNNLSRIEHIITNNPDQSKRAWAKLAKVQIVKQMVGSSHAPAKSVIDVFNLYQEVLDSNLPSCQDSDTIRQIATLGRLKVLAYRKVSGVLPISYDFPQLVQHLENFIKDVKAGSLFYEAQFCLAVICGKGGEGLSPDTERAQAIYNGLLEVAGLDEELRLRTLENLSQLIKCPPSKATPLPTSKFPPSNTWSLPKKQRVTELKPITPAFGPLASIPYLSILTYVVKDKKAKAEDENIKVCNGVSMTAQPAPEKSEVKSSVGARRKESCLLYQKKLKPLLRMHRSLQA